MKVSRSIRRRWCSLAILIVAAMLAASIAPALADTAITNCTELQNMSLTGAYYLANDIDCTCTSDWNSGVGFEPIGNGSNKFTGTFDGQGCKITGLYINRSSTDSVGLFGYLDSGSEIKDVGLDEVNISGYGTYNVGGLVGTNCGKITNCYSSGSVAGPSYVGGLVGENYIEITNCYSTGSVTGSGSNVGGLVSANYFKISNCYSTCSVSGSGSNVGGLVGMNGGGTITNSYYPEDDITCTGCDNTNGNTTKANLQNRTWLTTSPNNCDFDTVWGIVEGVTYPYMQWQRITISFAPPSPINDTVCTWRTFNVTINQEVNVSWYLNNSLLHTNQSIREANYMLHAQYVGENNVSALAENANGTAMQTWVWNVAAAPQTLNCTCGDICVDKNGWWRDGGVLNGSGTPIQAAVDGATAGETIYVWNGSYTENVNVNKQLTLRGEGADVVNVTNSTADHHVFDVTAEQVNISGFNVTGATGSGKAGICLCDSQHCNISDITAAGNCYGIYLMSSSNNNTLVNITANSNDEAGIYLSNSSNNNITDNTASQTDMGYGIYMSNANNNKLTNNNASYNNGGSLSYGIYMTSSSDNTFFNNTANSNPCSGIWLNSSSNNNTFINNTASSNNYTDFYSTSDSRNNTVEDIFISSYPTTVSFIYGIYTIKNNARAVSVITTAQL